MRTVFFAIRFGMTAIGLLLIAVGVLAAVFQQQLRGYGARYLSETGTRYIGVDFEVTGIGVSLPDRGLVLEGVRLRNPAGFSETSALQAEQVVLRPVWQRLFSEKPVFSSVEVRKPSCRVEYQAGAGANLAVLLKAIETAEQREGTAMKRQFLFEEVRCEDVALDLRVNPLPVELRGASVPAFRLDQLGTDEPATGAEVVRLVFRALAKKVLSINGLLPV